MLEKKLIPVVGRQYSSPNLEYLALHTPYGIVSIVRTKNNDYINPSELEKLVHTYEEKQALRKEVNSINEFNYLMKQYIRDGEKNILDNFLKSNNYPASRILEGREASNLISGAVAYTDTKNMFGVYLNFNKAIEKMKNQGQISDKIAKYIILTHELIHTAQNQDLESIVSNSDIYKLKVNMEYEAEMLVTALLHYKANTALEENKLTEAREYQKAINYIEKRAAALERLAKMKHVQLEKKDYLQNLVSRYENKPKKKIYLIIHRKLDGMC